MLPTPVTFNNAAKHPRTGAIHLILGPMMAGKTTFLHMIYQRLVKSHSVLRCVLVNHTFDQQREAEGCGTHTGTVVPCVWASTIKELLDDTKFMASYDVILINEGQFFSDLVRVSEVADIYQKTVYVAGLDGNVSKVVPEPVAALLPHCDFFQKINAVCEMCSQDAPFTALRPGTDMPQCVSTGGESFKACVGDGANYMAVCRTCFQRVQPAK